jgi:hypothetical protein
MAQLDLALDALRGQFKQSLNDAFAAKFDGRKIDTTYNLMHLRYVSTPSDGKAFTPEQIAFISGYEEAWLKASGIAATFRIVNRARKGAKSRA